MKKTKQRLTFLIYLSIFCHSITAQITHLEPLNWWIGMANPSLQLLVHGKEVGELTPFITYKGVTIKKITKGDSKNYLFIDLHIAKNAAAGTFKILFKKGNATIYTHDYTLLNRQQKGADFRGFHTADVMYMIMPDRFANGDESNDIVTNTLENKINREAEGARHGGDLKGITTHLDYIAAMGFTALWINPLLENNMPAYSYHGYAITNHYAVDPRFGTLEDYKTLAINAKNKGIKLIFDGVINHIGSNHWFMQDLPFKDWVNFPNTKYLTTHRRTTNQDSYASQYDKTLMTKGWFDVTMPDMNGANPFVATYLIQNSIWWIETLSLGGIRQDTYGYSDSEFLSKWSCQIMTEYPNFNIVGEEWSYNPLIAAYWQAQKAKTYNYKSCLKSTMDFPLQRSLVQALREKDDRYATKGWITLYEALANDFAYADPQNLLVFADNHDMDRIFTQLNEDVQLTQMALTYLLTTRGIPQIYYGTEVLFENTKHPDNHGFIRSDFWGGWKGDTKNAFTGEGLTAAQKEMQTYMKKLLNWRKNEPVIHQGKILHFAPFESMYVYFRYTNEKIIMVVLNKNEEVKNIDIERFKEILKPYSKANNIFTNEKVDLNALKVAPKSATVLEILR